MIFLNENTLNGETNDYNDVEAVSLGLEPGLEAGLVMEGMANDIFHTITEAVLIADAKELALRAQAALYEQAGKKTEAQNLMEKADSLQEGALSDMWAKIKNAFVKMWNWIKGLFMDFFKWLNSFLMDSKKFAKKYADAFDTYKSKLKSDWTFKGYKFPNIGKVASGINALSQVIKKVLGDMNKIIDASDPEDVVKQGASFSDNADDIEKWRAEARATALNQSGSLTDEEFRKKLRIYLYGSEEKEDLGVSDIPSTIMADIENGNKPIRDAQNVQREINTYYNDAIATVKRIESKLTKGANPADATKKSAALTKLVSALRFALSLENTASSAFIGAYRAYLAQCKAIVSRVITYRKINESADTSVLDGLLAMIR